MGTLASVVTVKLLCFSREREWRAYLHEMNGQALSAVSCCWKGLAVRPFPMKQPLDEKSLYFSRMIGKGDIDGYLFSTSVYAALREVMESKKAIEEVCMAATADVFKKWKVQVGEHVHESNDVMHRVWIVPAPFRCM